MAKDLRNVNLAFVDIETTGFNVSKHEIIEVACILVEGKTLKVLSEYEARVQPLHIGTADPNALFLTGYKEEKWADAVSPKQMLSELNKISKAAMFIGWNVAFDWKFLSKYFDDYKIKSLADYHLLDAMSIAYSELYKKGIVEKMRLSVVASKFGIKTWKKHSALEDARATYEVFKKIMC